MTNTSKPLVGSLQSTADRIRDSRGGRFAKHPKCDCCGRPCTEHLSDERVCGAGDGPGFYICGRRACERLAEKIESEGGLPALRAHYEETRRRNQASAP
jgi:hypothetical protein